MKILLSLPNKKTFNLSNVLLLFSLCLSNLLNAQTDNITLSIDNRPLSHVFLNITQQTGYRFSYSPQMIDMERKISINIQNKTLEETLELLLSDTVSYKRTGKYVILFSIKEDANKNNSADGEVLFVDEPLNSVAQHTKAENNHLIDSMETFPAGKKVISDNGIIMLNCHDTVLTKKKEKRMKSFLTAVLFLASVTATSLSAQEMALTDSVQQQGKNMQDTVHEEKRPMQLSFVYPLGTSWIYSFRYTYNFSLNVIGGVTGKIKGAEFASVFNVNNNSVRGFQAAGVFNLTGIRSQSENSRNVQFAGAFNFTGVGRSTQFAGGVNIADTGNFQASAAVNIAKKSNLQMTGGVNVTSNGKVQVSGVTNVASESVCQITAGVNITKQGKFQLGIINLTGVHSQSESSRDVQFAGAFNVTRVGRSTQFAGGVNIADTGNFQASAAVNIAKKSNVQMTGGVNVTSNGKVQISGVVNVASESVCQITAGINITKKGKFQLGIINIRDTADGVSLGVINIVKRGGVLEAGVEGGEFMHSSLTFRSGVQKLYTILSVGYNFSDKFGAAGVGLGTGFLWKNRIGLNLELMSYQLLKDVKFYQYNEWIQFRPVVSVRIADHFKIFAGPTANLLVQQEGSKTDVRVPYSILSLSDHDTHFNFWIGITGGLKF
jgi:hypothetical protein